MLSADESDDAGPGHIPEDVVMGPDARLAILGLMDVGFSSNLHPGIRLVCEDKKGICRCNLKKERRAEV